MNEQSIVFAFYKNDELIGYRQDTCGTIGLDFAKIYTYSKEQVATVLENINYNVQHKEGYGKALENAYKDKIDKNVTDIISNAEEKVHYLLQDKKAFEVRVLKAPAYIYEKNFNIEKAEWVIDTFPQYPYEEMERWLQYPEQHECIEVHYFSMDGLMLLN